MNVAATLVTVPRSATEAADMYPEFTRGVQVIVHPDWSFGQADRMHWYAGEVLGPVRNGYIRVLNDGCTCDHMARDLSLA